jgi:hypothetical protein
MATASTALKKSPLAQVNDDFGGKDKLVDKIVGVLDAEDESKDELRKRLLGVANRKLIRLHAVATQTKQAGGHDKLAAATADRLGRAKDKDYVTKLEAYSNGRLLDMMQAAERRAGAAKSAAARAESPKPARAPRPAPAAKAKPAGKAGNKAAKKPAAKAKGKKTASKRR